MKDDSNMKMSLKSFIVLVLVFNFTGLQAKKNAGAETSSEQTSIGMVIYTNDIETMWNALRLANCAQNEGDSVTVFLLGKGVELDDLIKTEKLLAEQSEEFLENGGVIMGCGTCLHSRKNNEPQVCSVSTMKDLYILIRSNKIILTF